jgi:hypothetical protein
VALADGQHQKVNSVSIQPHVAVRKADVVLLGDVQYWKGVKKIYLTLRVSRVTGTRAKGEMQETTRNCWRKGYVASTKAW